MFREDFPILSSQDFAYLDSAATMQKPQVVIDAVSDFYKTSNANPRRGLYDLSVKATEILEDTRKTVANFVGAKPEQIVFTKNATESLNLAAWLLKQHHPDAKVSAPLDLHHSALLPFANLFDLDRNGEISLRSGMSNVTGEMPDFDFATVIDSAQEVVHKRNLSEEEVTKAALANIRRGNQELKDLAEAMKHHRGGADYVYGIA
jgi:hypothetical protein